MKIFLAIGLLASLLAALLPPVSGRAAAEEAAGNAYHAAGTKKQPDTDFEIDVDGVLVKYHGTEENVTEIGECAFERCSCLTVVEGGSLTEIEAFAFLCSAICEIDLSNVKIIENSAFKDCRALEEVKRNKI